MPPVFQARPHGVAFAIRRDMEIPEAWTHWLDLLQWPAMVVTITASWLVASQDARRREWGFWVFLLSNVLWIAWGVPASAWALVVLQVALALLNIRGVRKNER